MVIWGNGPGEAGDEQDDGSPSGVSRGMVKVICPVLTARDGETDLKKAPRPVPTQQCCSCEVVVTASSGSLAPSRRAEVDQRPHHIESQKVSFCNVTIIVLQPLPCLYEQLAGFVLQGQEREKHGLVAPQLPH
jgi:hypothetical protein